VRIVEKSPEYAEFRASRSHASDDKTAPQRARHLPDKGGVGSIDHHDDAGARGALYATAGWSDCGHDDWRPGLTLDPFAGSGTTLAVATGNGRDALGFDIDHENVALVEGRIGGLMLEVSELADWSFDDR
jgi:hypothetical protein